MTLRRCANACALLAALCALAGAPARAQELLPPGEGVLTGLTGGSAQAFAAQIHKHPAVDGVFVTWGRSFESAFGQAASNHARLMLHISTSMGYGAPEQITPQAIARGEGDGYLLSLSRRIVQSGRPVYVRLFAEMNNANNAYCAFNQDGSARDAAHSIASFKAAWRRTVLILRGGPLVQVNARLDALGLPPVRGAQADGQLPRPQVAFLWVPETAGTPDTPRNSARAYYPGDAYVDWVGTDFYSRFPNFGGLRRFYSEYPGKPFAFGEWGIWGGDDQDWVRSFFSFVASHRRVRMALYNQGERADGPFRLGQYPRARLAIARALASSRFIAFAPEWGGKVATARKASAGSSYLRLAETGVSRALRLWRDGRLHWYDSRLRDRDRYPLATIWDAVPLFEALDAIELAAPSPAHRAAAIAFANGAERYYDRGLGRVPGYAPYPGDRGNATAWFDDNGWWGLAFLDAYRATGSTRYLRDAERAFRFIASRGWNANGGGLWWNTAHAYIAGEPLAGGSLLGAELFKLTGEVAYREVVLRFLGWGDAHFVSERGLYKRTSFDPTPTPYIEGTMVEAHRVLCEAGVGQTCAWAHVLADACYERFADRLNMGPQFDVIYLHQMLLYGSQAGDARWHALAVRMAASARVRARDANGLFLRGWDGTPITEHQAVPDMLQSDAATLELFAWLAAVR